MLTSAAVIHLWWKRSKPEKTQYKTGDKQAVKSLAEGSMEQKPSVAKTYWEQGVLGDRKEATSVCVCVC